MLKIKDKVKYYLDCGRYKAVIYGTIFEIHESTVYKNRKVYGAIRDYDKFQDFGYREDFIPLKCLERRIW